MTNRSDATTPNLKLTFADGFEPPLPAGSYKITAEQKIKISSEPAAITFNADKTVYVSAPRFVLNPGEVYSVYPPAGQAGAFHDALPHIVLTRKTLPWERAIDGAQEGTSATAPPRTGASAGRSEIRSPWMALLTLDDDEIAEERIEITSLPLGQFCDPPADIWRPQIDPEPGERVGPPPAEQDRCLVARIPVTFFQKIAPALDELGFLAHARRMGTEDKDLADTVADGWLAVVVGNRRPKPGIRNHGLLVSLEGLGKILKKQRSESRTSIPAQWVQPAILHHWTYVSEGHTFRQLLEGLTKRDGRERDVWLRVLPDQSAPESKALAALKLGYTALSHHMRQGGQTVSWYRGPLIPMPVEASTYHPIHTHADEALQYDPGTGLFNVSYAAAWQLGRLLALQNSDLANSLLYRRDGYVARGVLDEAKKTLNQGDAIEERAKLLLQDDLMIGLLTEWWLSAMGSST